MRPARWYDRILDWFRWDYMQLRWRSFWCPHADKVYDTCWNCDRPHLYCILCDRQLDKCGVAR